MVQQSKGWDLQNWRNERYARNCVLEFDNFGGGSVMMWGAISYTEKLNWCTSTATLAPLDTEMRF